MEKSFHHNYSPYVCWLELVTGYSLYKLSFSRFSFPFQQLDQYKLTVQRMAKHISMLNGEVETLQVILMVHVQTEVEIIHQKYDVNLKRWRSLTKNMTSISIYSNGSDLWLLYSAICWNMLLAKYYDGLWHESFVNDNWSSEFLSSSVWAIGEDRWINQLESGLFD